MSIATQLSVLVRREFWEHRTTFVILPLIITGFLMAMMVLAMLAAGASISIEDEELSFLGSSMESGNIYAHLVDGLARLHDEERRLYIGRGLQALATPFMLIWWFVSFFYLLGSLYEDRRDRSVLFWKSMPVSDALTVLAKLLTAVIIVPIVYLWGAAILQLTAMLLLTLSGLGSEAGLWQTLWSPAALPVRWLSYLGLVLFYGLWCLPFFAWLLVVSAWVKSLPLLWAIGIPMALIIVESVATRQSLLSEWMGQHVLPLQILDSHQSIFDNISAYLISLQMVVALGVGAGLILLAIWLRGKADEL